MKKKQDSLERLCNRHRKAIQKIGRALMRYAKLVGLVPDEILKDGKP